MTERQPRKLEDFGARTKAERKVLDELDTGELIVIGGDVPDTTAGEDRLIRARFLRWVILGCDGSTKHRVHEKGVQISGALITGEGEDRKAHAALDLEGAEVGQDLLLVDCRFTARPEMIGARMQSLILNRSHLPGLRADGLVTKGGVFLRHVESDGEIRLVGAQIGGDLACDGAKLRNKTGRALSADGARITGAFFWREDASAKGAIDLTAAEIGTINDDPKCWPGKGDLLLNRCQYGAFTGRGISAKDRLRWLGLCRDSWGEFAPQPYEHCAKVLREMGHQDDAREILIEKERRQRAARRAKETEWPFRQAQLIWDTILRYTIFYGHRPLFAGFWLLAFWVLGQNAYLAAWQADAFKPNNPFILRSAEWVRCSAEVGDTITLAAQGRSGDLQQSVRGLRPPDQTRQECFMAQAEGEGFPRFNSYIYSLDVLFPLVEVEQQANWVPDEDKPQGWTAKIMMYLQIIMGWALSLLAVAGLSGIIKSD